MQVTRPAYVLITAPGDLSEEERCRVKQAFFEALHQYVYASDAADRRWLIDMVNVMSQAIDDGKTYDEAIERLRQEAERQGRI